MGLTLRLNVGLDEYYCSSTASVGFKILLHNPRDTPKIREYGFSIEPGYELRIPITPIINTASPIIRRIPVGTRQCLFSDEFELDFFKTYSLKNCEMECEAKVINRSCGCVMPFMPRLNEDIVICDNEGFKCSVKTKLLLDQLNNDFESCDCLPGCTDIGYEHIISSSELVVNNSFNVYDRKIAGMDADFVKENIALIHFYIPRTLFRSYIKEEIMGLTDFVSNTGALLGLFMGFSVISLIEIVYFMSLYPFYIYKRFLKKPKISYKSAANNKNKKFYKVDFRSKYEQKKW